MGPSQLRFSRLLSVSGCPEALVCVAISEVETRGREGEASSEAAMWVGIETSGDSRNWVVVHSPVALAAPSRAVMRPSIPPEAGVFLRLRCMTSASTSGVVLSSFLRRLPGAGGPAAEPHV